MSERPEPVDEHVVFFTTALGDPAAERYPSLRAAVSRVEALCNDDDVQDAKVFRLVAVPLSVKSYVRVEIDDAAPDGPSSSESAEEGGQASPVPGPRDAEPLREERRPLRAIRDEAAPVPVQQRAETGEVTGEAADDVAPSDEADEQPTDPGRSLGFFVR